ncbi:hypothetical protein QEH44_gp64 [Arthrobacter phage Shambre1]|uniref:Uncharacterized protein n=1 Tax=Arthrobacter phage Shambre1 TaxID=2927284 RepID=A0A977KNN1_9CAUD|nr:hypothetical protein QEH44_gp64 [Arthrobacter phage Shambre1]UXE04800.1 hypothetical protein SEA_SHAMBRE1_64 [Arthrobacter phage Shambre1]
MTENNPWRQVGTTADGSNVYMAPAGTTLSAFDEQLRDAARAPIDYVKSMIEDEAMEAPVLAAGRTAPEYNQGGYLPQALTRVKNISGHPIRVFPVEDWSDPDMQRLWFGRTYEQQELLDRLNSWWRDGKDPGLPVRVRNALGYK